MDNLKLKGKRIVVTGGNGYLGRCLTERLKEISADVFVLDTKLSDSYNEICVDITDYTLLKNVINDIKPDYIFHLAALLDRQRDFSLHEKIMNVNYFGTVNLLKALQNINYSNLIFTSTSEVYGSNSAPFKETMCPVPASPYSMSKYFSEVAIHTFSDIYKKNYTILRLFNFYGSNMPESFFISQLISSLKNNAVFRMTKGEQKRDFIHVDDVVDAIMLAAADEHAKNEIFNVCSGVSLTLKDVAVKCKELLNSSSFIDFGALDYRENEIWDMTGDNSKISGKLGFSVKKNFKDMILYI